MFDPTVDLCRGEEEGVGTTIRRALSALKMKVFNELVTYYNSLELSALDLAWVLDPFSHIQQQTALR